MHHYWFSSHKWRLSCAAWSKASSLSTLFEEKRIAKWCGYIQNRKDFGFDSPFRRNLKKSFFSLSTQSEVKTQFSKDWIRQKIAEAGARGVGNFPGLFSKDLFPHRDFFRRLQKSRFFGERALISLTCFGAKLLSWRRMMAQEIFFEEKEVGQCFGSSELCLVRPILFRKRATF